MEILAFVLASLALLATPGPTNTLLFTSGAVAGLRPSLRLLVGELLGYMLSISVLLAILGPALVSHPELKLALQALCAGFLIAAARDLWMRGDTSADTAIGLDKVFVTTLLNPKGLIFASAVIPGDPMAGVLTRLPWLAVLATLIVGVGAGWIYAGAMTRARGGVWLSGPVCCRLGAAALWVFAGVLCWSAVASALSLYGGSPG